jgi:hypothetical protein
MQRSVGLALLALAGVGVSAGPAWAISIDLTSGTTGTTFINQSFNETRGVDVTVLGSSLLMSAMTLDEFNIVSGTGTVGARIYDSDTGIFLAGASQPVGPGFNQSVTIPISLLLLAGETYRVGFFIEAGGTQGSGDGFDPTPAGLDILDYLDSTGSLLMSQAFQSGSDAFPTNLNSFVPFITIEATAAVPEPSSLLLLVVAAPLLGLLRRHRA